MTILYTFAKNSKSMLLKLRHIIFLMGTTLVFISCDKDERHFNKACTLFNEGVELRKQQTTDAATEKFATALFEINKCKNQDSTTLNLKAQIEDNFGVMCWKHDLFTEAIDLHKDAADIFRNLNDTAMFAVALRNCGRVANSMGNKVLAKQYYDEAINIVNSLNNNEISGDIYLEYGRDILMEDKNYKKALDYISTAIQKNADTVLCHMALGLTYYYMYDDLNAEKHLLQALKSNKAGVKMSCYQTLSYIEQSRKNMAKTIEYQQLFIENMLISDNEKNIENIQRIKSEYDLKMQQQLMKSKQKTLLLWLVTSISAIIIILIVTLYYSKQKILKKQVENEQMKNQIYAAMKRNKVYVTALALSGKITSDTLNFTLNDNDWNDYIQLVDAVDNNFSKSLLNIYPTLNSNDLRICCLVRQGFSNKVVSILAGMNCTSLARRKWRIKQDKMDGDNERRNFDEIINQLNINYL